MRKRIDVITVVLFLIVLASFVAAAKGFGHHLGKGFFNGG